MKLHQYFEMKSQKSNDIYIKHTYIVKQIKQTKINSVKATAETRAY